MPRDIAGFSNPLVKETRSLRDKKHRRASGRFLAEGLRICIEALDAGHAPELLWRTAASADHPLVARLEAAAGDVLVTTPDILGKLSGKDNPGSVIGVYREPEWALGDIQRTNSPLWIVAQALRDPGNLGTILRTGDAVGAGGLILVDDCTDPFSVEAVRASMGAIFTQQVVQTDWAQFIEWLRAGPGELIGTSLNTRLDYQAVRYTAPTFILVGNEAQGLPPDYEAACDQLVKMPMLGKADSLNAAVATAVMAYEVINQRRAAAG